MGIPYLFPYENIFVVAVCVLIIGLLLVRMYQSVTAGRVTRETQEETKGRPAHPH
jgi:hypothetical protein